jgi:hypothetical protein
MMPEVFLLPLCRKNGAKESKKINKNKKLTTINAQVCANGIPACAGMTGFTTFGGANERLPTALRQFEMHPT